MASLIGNPRIHPGARWWLAAFYALLVIGAVTMVYPFWLMVSGSVSGEFDFRDRLLVPKYLFDRDELYAKFLVARYGDLARLAEVHGLAPLLRPADLRGRVRAPEHSPEPTSARDWEEFLTNSADVRYLTVAHEDEARFLYQDFVRARFSGTAHEGLSLEEWRTLDPVARMNRVYRQREAGFCALDLPPWQPGRNYVDSPIYEDFVKFLRDLPRAYYLPVGVESTWREWSSRRGMSASRVNLPRLQSTGRTQEERQFLAEAWSVSLVGADGILVCVENDWSAFLQRKYGTSEALAKAWGETVALENPPLPQRAWDETLFLREEGGLRWQYLTRNYRAVGRYLVEQSRAAPNTIVLVLLAILLALTINPLAAYALSRYPGGHSRAALLVMVLTIAFPSEVAMIPSFLLLRDLDLLNSYAALVLPGAVSGFGIFLLKGFFDGLPEELFECARVEGASDFALFWHVALPLSRPILAVIALGTFTATYGGYMWALLVCQDPRMWTLMVWLFQFQMTHDREPWMGMAAFVIASLPTLLVFVACQRIILRGIVIPTEK